jgi:hypothetical protein
MKTDNNDRGIEQDCESSTAGSNGNHNGKDPDNDRWRDLCRMVAEEKHPARMSALLDELITALDKRRQNFRQDGPAEDVDSGIDLMPEAEEN